MAVDIDEQDKISEYRYNKGWLLDLLRFKLDEISIVILNNQKYQHRDKVKYGIKNTIRLPKHVETENNNEYNHLYGYNIYVLKRIKYVDQIYYSAQYKQAMSYKAPIGVIG